MDYGKKTNKKKISQQEFAEEIMDACVPIIDAILAINEKISDKDFKLDEGDIKYLLTMRDWREIIKKLEEEVKKLTPEQL